MSFPCVFKRLFIIAAFSEKNFSVVRPLPPSQPPLPIIPFEHASDNDEEPAHDYDLPTNFGVATLDQSSFDRAAREVLTLDPTSVTDSQESAPRNKVQGGNGKSKGSPPPVKQKVKDKTRKTSVPTSVASHITGNA